MTRRIFLACTLGLVHAAYGATTGTWNITTGGAWDQNANWTPGPFPNAAGDTANFLNKITANSTITSGIGITVGNITFDNSNNYLVSLSGNTLTMNNGGTANITVNNGNGSGSHSISAPISLANPLSFTHSSSADFTISGAISGAKDLTKLGIGTGALVLSGVNSYLKTHINVGILQISSDSNLGTDEITFASGTPIAPGTLRTTATFTIPATRTIALSIAGTFEVTPAATTTTVNANISGAGSLIKTGAGTLLLTDPLNTYGLGTAIKAGVLEISAIGQLGLPDGITFDGGTLRTTATLTIPPISPISIISTSVFEVTPSATTTTVNSKISGAGSLTKTGAGTLTLTDATNSYGGGTFINAGVLEITNNGCLGPNSGGLTINGTTLRTSGSVNIPASRTISITSSATFDTLISSLGIASNISGAVSIIKTGPAGLTLQDPTNSYEGGTFINAGTLTISDNGALGAASGGITFDGGALLADPLIPPFILTIPATRAISITSAATFIPALGSTLTIEGVISGVGGTLSLRGGGTFILTGVNTYSGGTGINILGGGTLMLSGAGALAPTGAVTLNYVPTAIFDISGITPATGTTIGALSGVSTSSVVLGSKALTLGAATNTIWQGVISGIGGSIVKQGSGIIDFRGANTYTGGTIINNGTLSLTLGGTLVTTGAVTVNGATSAFDVSAITPIGLTIGDLSGVGTGSVALGNKILTFGTTLNTSFDGMISGITTSAIVKQGSGIAILSGPSTYTGGTTINAGTLSVSADTNLGVATGSITFGGGTLRTTVSFAIPATRTITITGAAAIFEPTPGATTTTVDAVIPGGGKALTKIGAGTLVLTAANTYGAGTTINDGTLSLANAGTLLSTGFVDVNSATSIFDISAITPATGTTIGDLSGAAGSSVVLGSKALTFGTGANTVFGGGISGAGSIVKQGAGITEFSGVNTFTGVARIDNGTLKLSGAGSLAATGVVNVNSGTSIFDISAITAATTIGDLSSAFAGGSVVLGSKALTFGTGTGSVTFAGVISGALGSIVKQGSGIAVLTGINTFTGGTTINNGTLSLSGAGVLDPTGAVTVNGTSTFNISAITAGGLVIGNLAGVGSSSVFLGGKTLTFGTGANTNFAGGISGTGAIIKQGSGNATLSGVSSFSGGTLINAGTLSLSGAGALLSTGTVDVNSASSIFSISGINSTTTIGNLSSGFATSSVVLGSKTLIFGTATGTVTFSGVISGGGGSIVKQGSGMVVFPNANTYTGGTTINNGTLRLTGTGALAPTGTVNVNSASSVFDITTIAAGATIGGLSGVAGSSVTLGVKSLTFGTTTNTTFAGNISGSVSLVKQGSGRFTVSGVNTFTGTFDVNAGELNMASTGLFPPASTTNIAAGATLTGTGTLGIVNLNGTVSPGNSIGTINVGNISFNSGSNYIVEISNTASDQIISSGVVTINPGATLTLVGSGLTFPLLSYLVIDSSMPLVRNGDFTLVNPFTRFEFNVQYDPQDVLVLLLRSVSPFSGNGNAAGPARCFSDMIANLTLDLIDVLNVLNRQSVAEWQNSFNQMQPSNFDDIAFAEENVAERIRQNFSAHLFEQRVESCPHRLPGELPWRLWLAPFVGHVHQHGRGEHEGYKENFRGVTVAADYQFMKRWTLTSGFSWADSDVNVVGGGTSGDFQTYAGSVGAIWKNSHFFVDGLLSYLFSSVHGSRSMLFTAPKADSVFLKAKHHQDSNQLMAHFGGKYEYKINTGAHGTLNVYPFINVDYLLVMQDGYQESGAQSLNLSVSSKNYDLVRPEGGLGIGYVGCFERARVNADVSVSFIREERMLGKKTKAHFINNSCTFKVKGLSPNNNLVSPTARLTVSTTKASPVSCSIEYHGEFGTHFIENTGEVEIKVAF